MRLSHQIWTEIERLLVTEIFWRAAFEDGPWKRGGHLERLQKIVNEAIADGMADALDEDGQVPDVMSRSAADGCGDAVN